MQKLFWDKIVTSCWCPNDYFLLSIVPIENPTLTLTLILTVSLFLKYIK